MAGSADRPYSGPVRSGPVCSGPVRDDARGNGKAARDPVILRPTRAEDEAALARLYAEAFADEDLMPLVAALHGLPDCCLSVVATVGPALVGHGMFTYGAVAGNDGRVALLGPLAVDAGWRRQGIGRRLVATGLGDLRRMAVMAVYVLGDPAYYGRLGFGCESAVVPPYPVPPAWAGAWQSRALHSDRPMPAGLLRLPAPWMRPALWRP